MLYIIRSTCVHEHVLSVDDVMDQYSTTVHAYSPFMVIITYTCLHDKPTMYTILILIL